MSDLCWLTERSDVQLTGTASSAAYQRTIPASAARTGPVIHCASSQAGKAMAETVVRIQVLNRNTLMFCALDDDTMARPASLEFSPKDPAQSR